MALRARVHFYAQNLTVLSFYQECKVQNRVQKSVQLTTPNNDAEAVTITQQMRNIIVEDHVFCAI